MLQDSGRSRVICLSLARYMKYIIGLLSLEKYKWWKGNWWPSRDMIWVLVGVRGCVAVDVGHSLVTLFSLSMLINDWSLHKPSRQVTDLLSWAHTWVWALGRLIALLSWVSALFGPTVRVLFWWRRSVHHTESRTQRRGLGVPVWTGT